MTKTKQRQERSGGSRIQVQLGSRPGSYLLALTWDDGARQTFSWAGIPEGLAACLQRAASQKLVIKTAVFGDQGIWYARDRRGRAWWGGERELATR